MIEHEERLPLDKTPTIPLRVVRTPTMIDELKHLGLTLLRWTVIGVSLVLGVCAFIAAQKLWGDWDAGFWRYAAGFAALAAIVFAVFRTRTRRASRSYSREGY